jgi:hypothetical protein
VTFGYLLGMRRLALAVAAATAVFVLWTVGRDVVRAPARGGRAAADREDAGIPAGDTGPSPAPPDGAASPPTDEPPVFRFVVISGESGQPIPNAVVRLDGEGLSGVTAEDGAVVIRGKPYEPYYYASATGYAQAWGRANAGRTTWVELVAGAMLSGAVLHADTRAPVPATVVVAGVGPGRWFGRAETDVAGRFEIVVPRWQPLVVTADALEPAGQTLAPTIERVVVREARHEVELLMTVGGTLEGKVLVEGRPAEGEVLAACWDASREFLGPVPLDEAGSYRLRHLPLSADMLPAASIGGELTYGDAARFTRAGETLRRDIRVPPKVHVRVAVEDPEGRGVEAFDASLTSDSVRLPADEEDDRGRAVFTAEPDEYVLAVRAEGWVKHERDLVLVAGKDAELTVRLTAGEAVEGTVIDGRGAPVHAQLSCGETASARTDAAGRFRIAGLPPGPVRLDVVAEGMPGVQADATPGGPPVVVVVPSPARLRGRIGRAPEGVPATIHLWPGGAEQELPLSGVVLDVPVTRLGQWLGLALRFDGVPAPTVLEVSPLSGGEVRDLGDIPLDRGAVLRGTVVDPSGRAIPGARVTVAEPWTDVATRCGAEGEFSFPRMPTRPVWLRVDAEGWATRFVRFAEQQPPSPIAVTPGGLVEVPGASPGSVTVSPLLGHMVDADTAQIVPQPGDHGQLRARLQAGPYRAHFYWRGKQRSVDFAVREGGTTTIDGTMPR